MKDFEGQSVVTRCDTCHRLFDRYVFSRHQVREQHLSPRAQAPHKDDPEFQSLFELVPQMAWADWIRVMSPRKGVRTGTGLHLEEFEGRLYVRKVCKCGANQKWSLKKFAELPVTEERGEPVVYL